MSLILPLDFDEAVNIIKNKFKGVEDLRVSKDGHILNYSYTDVLRDSEIPEYVLENYYSHKVNWQESNFLWYDYPNISDEYIKANFTPYKDFIEVHKELTDIVKDKEPIYTCTENTLELKVYKFPCGSLVMESIHDTHYKGSIFQVYDYNSASCSIVLEKGWGMFDKFLVSQEGIQFLEKYGSNNA